MPRSHTEPLTSAEAQLTDVPSDSGSADAESSRTDHQAEPERMSSGHNEELAPTNGLTEHVKGSGTPNDANARAEADGEVDDELGGVPVEVEHVSPSKKKRKKSKPKSQRGLVSQVYPLH